MDENNQISQEIPARNALHSDAGGKNTKNNNNKGVNKYIFASWEFLKIVIIAAIIVLPIRYFIFQPFIVKGESMVPNLQSGDYLIVDELSFRIVNPKRGDVIVLKYPLDDKQRFIKRIIGLPGETVNIKNSKITITKDDKSLVLDEKKYLPNVSGSTDGNINITLGNNKYFVLGDNRQFSYDSRKWGVLPKEDIIGKAIFRLFPITNISFIASPSY